MVGCFDVAIVGEDGELPTGLLVVGLCDRGLKVVGVFDVGLADAGTMVEVPRQHVLLDG